MNARTLIRSKTFWTGIGSIAAGVGMIINGEQNGGITLIVQGLIAIFVRDAIAKKG